jgi:hypothetical protein
VKPLAEREFINDFLNDRRMVLSFNKLMDLCERHVLNLYSSGIFFVCNVNLRRLMLRNSMSICDNCKGNSQIQIHIDVSRALSLWNASNGSALLLRYCFNNFLYRLSFLHFFLLLKELVKTFHCSCVIFYSSFSLFHVLLYFWTL